MSEPSNTPNKSMAYRFGEFELNAALGELHKSGEVVDVQKRVLDLLLFLVQHRDRTLSKDELQDGVWPGTVISETALTRAVMKARRAVGDDAATQAFIKTLHGQGYRFVGAVEEVSAELVTPLPAKTGAAEGASPATVEAKPSTWQLERKRAMLRLATTYGAAAWLLSQVATMVWEAFEWDKLPLQWLIAVILIGFPVALLIGWFYRSTPQGLKLRSEVAASDQTISSQPYIWVIGMLSLALILSLGWNLRMPSQTEPTLRIAILPTANQTQDPALDWISLGMLSLLNSQLADAQLATVSVSKLLRYLEPSRGQAPPTTTQLIETLSLAEGVGVVVETQMSVVGGRFVATGRLLRGQTQTALPEFSGEQPSAAMRGMGRYLLDYLQPDVAMDGELLRLAATGDPFTDQAYARGMHEKLSGNLQQAKELLEVAAQGNEQAFWPAYELALSIAELGDLDAAAESYLVLLERAEALGAPLQIATLSNALGIYADLRGNLDQSQRYYEKGIQWAQEQGLHQRLAELWINYAVLERARANPTVAQDYLGRAFNAYQDAGVTLLPGDFFITLGNLAADTGDVREAQRQYQQALTNFRRLDRPAGSGIALSNLSWASQVMGELDAAEQYLAESVALRKTIGDKVGLVKSEIRQSNLAYSRGNLGLAQSAAFNVTQAPYAQQEQELLASAHNALGLVALDREQFARAQDHFQQALALEEAGGRVYGQLNARIGLARTHFAAGEVAQARTQTARIIDSTQAQNMPKFALQAEQVEAKILLQEGDAQEAMQRLEAAANQAGAVGEDSLQALLATDLANIALDLEDITSAQGWAGIASQLLPDHGRVRLLAARMAFVQQEHDKARELTQQAQALLGERIATDAQALLARYAVPASP